MDSGLPLRLIGRRADGELYVFDTHSHRVDDFDIISYRWGDKVPPYDCKIPGVGWQVEISKEKLADIKDLMANVDAEISYLWADCICINQSDDKEKSFEISRMYEYYKRANKCHILIDMPYVWDPQEIVDDLKFLDHTLYHMGGAALASDAMGLTANLTNRLAKWANRDWTFRVDKSAVRSAAIDMGVINCYSTCINHVRMLFRNLYFSRVWTFQEMILGKNITMWGVNPQGMARIGELPVWMDLATDAKDKAYKLHDWIDRCRRLNTGAVNAVLRVIEEDELSLSALQIQVMGISSARTDIINGGPYWWRENFRGISNIFSAVSLRPRECFQQADLFKGLLGVFSGLFTAEEIASLGNDLEQISFAFFRQLSIETGDAWTKLSISSRDRGEWDWIPVVENSSDVKTTDCFAGVIRLGRLKKKGQAKTIATTGVKGAPKKYMTIRLKREDRGFHFQFKGCNCGRQRKTGLFSSEPIPTYDQLTRVVRDETGRMLVQCATILGSLIDPGRDVVSYRQRLLRKLQPMWNFSDPNARPTDWIDRCVSGTPWQDPVMRAHDMSMNCNMVDMTDCGSRLWNESTKDISCEVRINCGCVINAPFAFVFEALTSVENSSLGETAVALDDDNRIVLQDGMGLVQAADVGRTFNLVAFGGHIGAHKSFASSCRGTKIDKPIVTKLPWPAGRALVREEFDHDMTNMMRNYGYVNTGGSGNLLICRNHPIDQYRIIGVCIDNEIESEKGESGVTIR